MDKEQYCVTISLYFNTEVELMSVTENHLRNRTQAFVRELVKAPINRIWLSS